MEEYLTVQKRRELKIHGGVSLGQHSRKCNEGPRMMPYGYSSRSNQPNSDGSVNVFCGNCRDFIGTSYSRVQRATCYVCQAAEEGHPLTEEAILQYRLSKGLRSTVSALNLPEPDLRAVGIKRKKFSFGNAAGLLFTAAGRFMSSEKTGPQATVAANTESSNIARAKRRPRLFSNVSIEDNKTTLGTMQEVDKLGEKGVL